MNFWHAPLKQIHQWPGKRLPRLEGEHFCPRGECTNAPTRCGRIHDIVGGPCRGADFSKGILLLDFWKTPHPAPPNVWWKGEIVSSCKQKLVSNIYRCASHFFFSNSICEKLKGCQNDGYVRVSGKTLSTYSPGSTGIAKLQKLQEQDNHWPKIISYSK